MPLGVLLKAVPHWVCALPAPGQKGLSAAAKGSDGRGPPTQLLSYLCKWSGVNCLPDLVRSSLNIHMAKMSMCHSLRNQLAQNMCKLQILASHLQSFASVQPKWLVCIPEHIMHMEAEQTDFSLVRPLKQSPKALCLSRWVYAEAGWARIAALAPAVVACAQNGDQVAHHILQEGISDLVTTVQAVVKQLNMLQPFQLVLAGGMHNAPACLTLSCWGSLR